ncbi:homoserine kinase [Kroppenstedtia sanguinis]|uniref:Homoserine kinase n=1 Tax=Kroppenstedtia sanguinis TaxID=1380684 RepID=A0ABW4C933_9BACL
MDPFLSFEVTVPGSSANLGSGFDSIGMAVNRFLHLRFSPAEEWTVTAEDESFREVMQKGDNLILEVMKEVFQAVDQQLPPFRLEVESEIPLMRGLGSSAAAIVGGLMAANHLLGDPFSVQELFRRAVHREGHPDNVGPSLFGGVVVASWDGEKVHAVPAPLPPFSVIAVIPELPLATSRSRKVLPAQLRFDEAVLGSSRANLLTAALFSGDWDAFGIGLRDRFHQPFRSALVPGLNRVLQESVLHGALGAALSGAGPTMAVFTFDPKSVRQFVEKVFQEEGIPVQVLTLSPQAEGAVIRLTEGMRS